MKPVIGGSYYYHDETNNGYFLVISKTSQVPEGWMTFVFLMQANDPADEHLDGKWGENELRFSPQEQKRIQPIEVGFDWIASNNFAMGTPQQQLIQACFVPLY
jgi:hypothetical protein